MTEPLLEIRQLCVRYGAIEAVKHIDLYVNAEERVTVIGANGAGKTSTLGALTGLLPVSSGDIRFAGRSLQGISAHERLRKGIALVPEGRGIFARMSVIENLQIGAFTRTDSAQVDHEIEGWLGSFPNLKQRLHHPAGLLSGGEQQMLALARALLSRPRLLVLDEPSMGLAPMMVERVFSLIDEVCQHSGMALLLIEQNARLALNICDRAYVMESGQISMEGSSASLQDNPHVQAAYLGE